ncbi:hypothetical protein A2U01_0027894, partial [Trifolium medium]|nr:hypothetical protein [Trifolium medium]
VNGGFEGGAGASGGLGEGIGVGGCGSLRGVGGGTGPCGGVGVGYLPRVYCHINALCQLIKIRKV